MNMAPVKERWFNSSLGFIYPENCQVCLAAHATPAEGYVCHDCWQKVRFIKPPFCKRCGLPYEGDITTEFECSNCRGVDLHFTNARSAVLAREPVLDVIHRYKYQRALWFEPFLADLLIRAAVPELAKDRWDFIVPVPLHPAKQREREFNQAERLGACLSRATRIPLNTKLVRRVQPTQTQTRLSREQRAANVSRAFAMRTEQRLDGLRLLVLDDVFTTGATTASCAKVLMSAGAESVCVWTVARGL